MRLATAKASYFVRGYILLIKCTCFATFYSFCRTDWLVIKVEGQEVTENLP